MRRHLVPAVGRRLAGPLLVAVLVRVEAEVRRVELAEDHVHDADEDRIARRVADGVQEAIADAGPVRPVGLGVVVEVADARPGRPEAQFLIVLVIRVLIDVEAQLPLADRRQAVDHPEDLVVLADPVARHAGTGEELLAGQAVGHVHRVRPGTRRIRDRPRVPAEERVCGADLDGAHALGQIGEVDDRALGRAEALARQVQRGIAVRVRRIVADRLPRTVQLVVVGLDLLERTVEVDVAQVLAVADLGPLGDEGDDLPVRTPRRFAVVLEVAGEIVRLGGAVRRDQPDVEVRELVRQLGDDPLAVGTPGVAAALRGLRSDGEHLPVRRREREDAARILPGEARAVGTDAQRRTLGPRRDKRRLAEAGVLPPRLERILRLGLHHLRRVAAVAQVVERLAVRREDALAFMRPRLAVHERRLADDRVHHVEVATRRESDLRAVVAERDVAVGVVVPARVIAPALRRPALGVARLGLEEDALGRDLGIRRVEAPEVELLAEEHRPSVRAERRLENVMVGEERQLRLLSRPEVVMPDVAHAAARV